MRRKAASAAFTVVFHLLPGAGLYCTKFFHCIAETSQLPAMTPSPELPFERFRSDGLRCASQMHSLVAKCTVPDFAASRPEDAAAAKAIRTCTPTAPWHQQAHFSTSFPTVVLSNFCCSSELLEVDRTRGVRQPEERTYCQQLAQFHLL